MLSLSVVVQSKHKGHPQNGGKHTFGYISESDGLQMMNCTPALCYCVRTR